MKLLLRPPAIADDGSVDEVCCDKVGLFPKPITEDIVGAGESLLVRNELFHDHRLDAGNIAVAIQKYDLNE